MYKTIKEIRELCIEKFGSPEWESNPRLQIASLLLYRLSFIRTLTKYNIT